MRLIGLLLLAIGFRFFSFFPTIIDHDESTYLVIAQQMLEGQVYWKDIFDTKPPGIFYVYMGLITLAGKHLFLLRLLVALWIGFTAWGIYNVAKQWIPSGPGPWGAGVGYILLTSIYSFFGLAPNSELFFAGLSVGALWLIVRYPWQWWSMAFAGLLLGCGIAIKQVAAFDALAMGIFLLVLWFRQKQDSTTRLLKMGLLTIMSVVPLMAIGYAYYKQGFWDSWYFHQFIMPGLYLEERGLWPTLKYILDFALRFAPFILLAVWAVIKKAPHLFLPLLWLACGTIPVLLPGNDFGHYTIQWMPPIALLTGLAFHPYIAQPAWWKKWMTQKIGWGFLAILLIVILGVQAKDYFSKTDAIKLVMAKITETTLNPILANTPSDQIIFTGDSGFQILYFLLDAKPPVRYPHRSLLWEEEHRETFSINLEKELKPIYDNPPLYCVMSFRQTYEPFNAFLEANYTPIDTLKNHIVLYHLQTK